MYARFSAPFLEASKGKTNISGNIAVHAEQFAHISKQRKLMVRGQFMILIALILDVLAYHSFSMYPTGFAKKTFRPDSPSHNCSLIRNAYPAKRRGI
ncbi:protein of unknown function [Candidatus Nitrotoga arctica]|uniref:Uncharacterized protein n=1 Tax=Candidatus Nitrotoga arctica TaxID=453162 RepID=A0ABN8AKN2_9PROT|nr:protein of unknown function [Candidatus Nitrotoga arctica]